MARKKSSSSSKKNNTTTTKQNRNLIKQILGRWRTQRKAPVTLPPMPNLSIDRVPSRKTPILLTQQTGRKIRSQPDEQSVDKIARREKVCKKRPDSKKAQKGTGGSKEFVPWCK